MVKVESSPALLRQAEQLAFLHSGENIEVGSEAALPLSKAILVAIDRDSPFVEKVYDSGLTAIVYCINVNGKRYNLKKKRDVIRVKNDDGYTSFLNEVQRRRDFTELKRTQPNDFIHIVETIYASLADGMIVSPWIDGELVKEYKPYIFEQLFSTIVALELNGLFEWDFCPGNIIDDGHQIWLFDFGYMYKHDPLIGINSNGMAEPLFHGIERFETRNFFDFVVRQQEKIGKEAIMLLYRQVKEIAFKHYQLKLVKLMEMHASDEIIVWQSKINEAWATALESDDALSVLYDKESFRSFLLDALDDIKGQSCSLITLKKLRVVIELVQQHYTKLAQHQAFFFGDETLPKSALVLKYKGLYEQAKTYQLD